MPGLMLVLRRRAVAQPRAQVAGGRNSARVISEYEIPSTDNRDLSEETNQRNKKLRLQ